MHDKNRSGMTEKPQTPRRPRGQGQASYPSSVVSRRVLPPVAGLITGGIYLSGRQGARSTAPGSAP